MQKKETQMFTPKLLAVAFAATFTLTACNSSTTKPSATTSFDAAGGKGFDGKPVQDNAHLQPAGLSGIKEDKPVLSVLYSKLARNSNEVGELAEEDHLEVGDRVKIDITAEKEGYMYVYQIDGVGTLRNVLKIAGYREGVVRVKAGENISLPKEGYSYRLDKTKGVEHIFVAFLEQKDSTIEHKYLELARELKGKTTSAKDYLPGKGFEPAIISDTGKESTRFEGDITKSLPSKRISCNKQPSCVNSISYFNNM